MFANIRQLRYPAEFRIDEPFWPNKLLGCAEDIVSLLQSPQKDDKELVGFLRTVGNGLWRIRNRLNAIQSDSKEIRSAMRFLEATWESLTQSGVDIQDHTGEIVTGGEALRIIAFEPSSQVTEDQVIETIKPTIYYKNKVVQMGEVIVGQPQQEHEEAETLVENALPV